MKLISILRYILLISIALFLFSCTSNKNIVYLRNIQQELHDATGYKIYRVQPKDLLYIRIVSSNKDINQLFNNTYSETNPTIDESYLYLFGYLVSDSGYVSLPVLGKIQVIGLSLLEIQNEIEKVASKYLNEFTVSVKLAYFKISILGEVNNPGLFPVYQDNINIFHALSLAGDITDNGNKRNVLIIRNVKDKIETIRINLTDKSLISSEYYNLMPGDILYVQPVKAKALRIINAPSIQIMLQTITTTIIVMSFILNKL